MKEIPGFEGRYAVTSCGKVYSIRYKRFLKLIGGKGNYQMIGLYDAEGNYKQEYVHRLVAKTYIPNPCGYKEVNHKDEIKDHNWVDNLEWCSRKYNINYGSRSARSAASRTGMKYKKYNVTHKQCPLCGRNISTANFNRHYVSCERSVGKLKEVF